MSVTSSGTRSGGWLHDVSSGVVSSGVGIPYAGRLDVLYGGTAVETTLGRHARLRVSAGGVAIDTTFPGGGIEVVFGGGVAIDTTAGNLVDGGVTTGTIVVSGGRELVYGGVASGTLVSSGGLELVRAGVTSGTIISSGGYESVRRHGEADGTVVYGEEKVGGVASDTVVSGGLENVGNGAEADGTVVYGGGFQVVQQGGVASGTVIDGGELYIKSGGSTGSAAVTFATSAGGILRLESSLTYSGLVAGFDKSDRLDFRDIAFTSGVTSATWTQSGTTSGTLAVTSGTETATITLLGQYVAGNFHVRTDNHGGTLVTDPPVSASQTVALVNPH
jgi:autotransporter passenger strand-loop-strand repeat protein